MSTQGIGNVPSSDVPVILTEKPGSAAPTSVYGETGTLVPQSTLTALFNQGGNYEGSYGIDPDTGAFAAWDANGNEVSYQAFSTEHQLASGAVAVSPTGGSAVLYNASGNIIGLEATGYIVSVANSAQTGSVVDGLTDVYDETGSSLLGSFGYSTATNDLELNGASADSALEAEGFTAAQISSVEQSVEANAGWDPSNTTDVSMKRALIELQLSQSNNGQGTVSTGVYDKNGNFVGTFAGYQGNYQYFDQSGTASEDPTSYLEASGITDAEQFQALRLLTAGVPVATSDYTNLLDVDQALSAYLLDQGLQSPLSGAVDVAGGGNFAGNVGIDSATGQLAIETNGTVVDWDAVLGAQYGLSSTAITTAQSLWTSSWAPLSPTQESTLAQVTEDLEDDLLDSSNNPFANLTPAQVASDFTAQQLAQFNPAQIMGLTAAQVNALSATQIAALSAGSLSVSTLGGLTQRSIGAIQASQLNAQQVEAVGIGALSATQVASLSAWTLNALNAQSYSALSTAQLQAITAAQIGALTPSQLAMLSAQQLSALNATQLSGLDSWQLNGLSVAQVQALNTGALSPSAFAGLRGGAIEAFAPSQITGFTVADVAALGVGADALVLSQLSPPQLSGLTTAAVAGLSTADIQSLNPAQFAQLNVSGLTSQQLAVVTAPQLAAVPNYVAGEFSAAQLNELSAAQLQAITPAAIAGFSSWDLYNLSPEQIGALTSAQVAALSGPQVSQLSAGQMGALSPTQITALNPTAISGLTSAAIGAFSSQQVAALSQQQISALSASQLADFSDSQLGSFGATQVEGVTTQQVAAITVDQQAALENAMVTDGLLADATGAQGLNNPIGPLEPTGPSVTVGNVASQLYQDQGFSTAQQAASATFQIWGGGSPPGYASSLTQLSPTQWEVGATIYTYDNNGNLISSVTVEANQSQLTLNYQNGEFVSGQLQSSDGAISNPQITAGANGTVVVSEAGIVSNQVQIVSTGPDSEVVAAGFELTGANAAIGTPTESGGAEGFTLGQDAEEAGAEQAAAASGDAAAESVTPAAPYIGLMLGTFSNYYSFNVVGASGTTVSVQDGLLGSSTAISNPGSSTTAGYDIVINEDAVGDVEENIFIENPDGTIATENLDYSSGTGDTTITIGMGPDTQTETVSGNQTDAQPTLQTLPTNLLSNGPSTTKVLTPEQSFQLNMAAESMSNLFSMSESGDFQIDVSQTTDMPLTL